MSTAQWKLPSILYRQILVKNLKSQVEGPSKPELWRAVGRAVFCSFLRGQWGESCATKSTDLIAQASVQYRRSPQYRSCQCFGRWTTALTRLCWCPSGDERGPQHAKEGEAGATVQAQGEHAALTGWGGGPAAGPAEGLLRPQLQGLQAQSHHQETRPGARADTRGEHDSTPGSV